MLARDCRYATSHNGELCQWNAFPEMVEGMYQLKAQLYEISGNLPETEQLISTIENNLFKDGGVFFNDWLDGNRILLMQKLRRISELRKCRGDTKENIEKKKDFAKNIREYIATVL